MTAAANVENAYRPIQKEFDATLASPNNQQVVGTSGQVAAGRVDTLKTNAHALNERLRTSKRGRGSAGAHRAGAVARQDPFAI